MFKSKFSVDRTLYNYLCNCDFLKNIPDSCQNLKNSDNSLKSVRNKIPVSYFCKEFTFKALKVSLSIYLFEI